MEKKLVPTHKYKTTILFYDDNPEYLKFLENNLISDQYKFKFVTTLDEFKSCIDSSEKIRKALPLPFIKLDNELSDYPEHEAFDFNISNINKLKGISDKSDEISIAFIDNNLKTPNYNGISICESISHYPFIKVLLTGDCDRVNAINALNSKTIDLYIEKHNLENFKPLDNLNIIEKILIGINKFANMFFINNNVYTNELLSDRSFKQLFDKVIADNNILDYYLLDKETFLLVHANGKENYFKCWREARFDEYFELYYDAWDNKKIEELNNIKNKKLIPVERQLIKTIEFKNLYYCIY